MGGPPSRGVRVSPGACTGAVTPWHLVGVDPRLIDPGLIGGGEVA